MTAALAYSVNDLLTVPYYASVAGRTKSGLLTNLKAGLAKAFMSKGLLGLSVLSNISL